MKKFLYVLLASSFLLASCGDDDKKDNNNNNNNNNQNQNQNQNQNDQNQNQNQNETTSIDYDKFCNNVMGKSCGHAISDQDIASCKQTYADVLKDNAQCKDDIETYYKCVAKIDAKCNSGEECDCIPDDACKTEVDKASACINKNKGVDVDYNKFCNIVMGKICGYDISDDMIAQCVDIYSDETANHLECKNEAKAYYDCVITENDAFCAQTLLPLCESEIDAYDACLKQKYTLIADASQSVSGINFTNFCKNVMGKSCGAEISDNDMNWCESLYAEEYKSHSKCTADLGAYYKCVADISANECAPNDDTCECIPDDACKDKVEKAHNCLLVNYPEEIMGEQ